MKKKICLLLFSSIGSAVSETVTSESCQQPSECRFGQTCKNGQCAIIQELYEGCQQISCSSGSYCIFRQCYLDACKLCFAGQECKEGKCIDPVYNQQPNQEVLRQIQYPVYNSQPRPQPSEQQIPLFISSNPDASSSSQQSIPMTISPNPDSRKYPAIISVTNKTIAPIRPVVSEPSQTLVLPQSQRITTIQVPQRSQTVQQIISIPQPSKSETRAVYTSRSGSSTISSTTSSTSSTRNIGSSQMIPSITFPQINYPPLISGLRGPKVCPSLYQINKVQCPHIRPTEKNCPTTLYLGSYAFPNPKFCGIRTDGSRVDYIEECTACKDPSIQFYFKQPCHQAPFVCSADQQCNGEYCLNKKCSNNNECPYDWQSCVNNKCIDKCATMRCRNCKYGTCLYEQPFGKCNSQLRSGLSVKCQSESWACIAGNCVDRCLKKSCPANQKCNFTSGNCQPTRNGL